MQLLINHLGYELQGKKHAVLVSEEPQKATTQVQLINAKTGETVAQLQATYQGSVDNWQCGYCSCIDFSNIHQTGRFYLSYHQTNSEPFEIKSDVLFTKTFSDLLHYFKSQRCGGEFERYDQQVKLYGSEQRIDARGGWYDASGDVSKYLSHLSYAHFFNPQQIPMVIWNLLKSAEQLRHHKAFTPFTLRRVNEEAVHGADFLMRMQAPQGFFYITLFDQWSKHTEQREICAYSTQKGIKSSNYHAGFRQGGGIAIAALARASRQTNGGEFTVAQYLEAAERGYQHLLEHNCRYLDDAKENIIDEYCALLASVELYQTTEKSVYLEQSRFWATRLSARQNNDMNIGHFWSANDDGSRPYFHAAEAGLPGLVLCEYLNIEPDSQLQHSMIQIITQAAQFELSISTEVSNPFGYPRQYVKDIDGPKRSAFFIAQNNETGYWWQGENARLGSLACFAYQAITHITEPLLKAQLLSYAQHCLDWILGLNPFDICMLDGHGRNNPDYLPHLGFFNAKGGICNGITAGVSDPHTIAFNPAPYDQDMQQNWRWAEQWIPHAAWFLLAVSFHSHYYQLQTSQAS